MLRSNLIRTNSRRATKMVASAVKLIITPITPGPRFWAAYACGFVSCKFAMVAGLSHYVVVQERDKTAAGENRRDRRATLVSNAHPWPPRDKLRASHCTHGG